MELSPPPPADPPTGLGDAGDLECATSHLRFAGRPWRAQAVRAATGQKACQDQWLVTDDFAAVADGVKPLDDANDDVVAYFAQRSLEALRDHRRKPFTRMVESALDDLDPPVWPAPRDDPPACALGLARVAGGVIELASIADCLVVAADVAGQPVAVFDNRVGPLDDEVQRAYEQLVAEGEDRATASLEVRRLVAENRALRNREIPRSFWVFSDTAEVGLHAYRALLPATAVRAVLLCTDGFVRLWRAFGVAANPGELLSLARTDGLPKLAQEVRALEREAATSGPGLKGVHDDICAVLLEPA